MIRLVQAISEIWLNRHNRDTPERRAARAAVAHFIPAVVITGGSRGIGYALARLFLEQGRTVLLIARTAGGLDVARARLPEAYRAKCHTLACDIAHADVPARIDKALSDAGCYLDILVNNAAIGRSGSFAAENGDALEALIAVNVAAPARLMRHALSGMLARGSGGIITMASLGGYVPGPNQAAYYASKAHALSLSEAVASEVSGHGVRVCAVAAGPVATGFHGDMGAASALYRTLLPEISADRVARAAYRGFLLGRRVIVPGVVNRLISVSLRLLPHPISVPLTGWLLKNRDTPG